MPVSGRKFIRVAQYLFLLIGLSTLGYCVAVWWSARVYQARESRRFEQKLRATAVAPAQASAPATPPAARHIVRRVKAGGIVGKLRIPRLGVSVMVVEGDTDADLQRGVGHIPGTALPWEDGNVGLAGHRDTFFRPLHAIHKNDVIELSTLQGSYGYRVISTQIVGPRDVQVLDPTGANMLTLVTCFPFNYVGAAPKRFIVHAQRSPGS